MVGLVSGDLGLLAVGPPHVREEGAALRELFPAVLAEGPVVDFDPLANRIIGYFGHLMRRNVKINLIKDMVKKFNILLLHRVSKVLQKR